MCYWALPELLINSDRDLSGEEAQSDMIFVVSMPWKPGSWAVIMLEPLPLEPLDVVLPAEPVVEPDEPADAVWSLEPEPVVAPAPAVPDVSPAELVEAVVSPAEPEAPALVLPELPAEAVWSVVEPELPELPDAPPAEAVWSVEPELDVPLEPEEADWPELPDAAWKPRM